MPFFGNATTAPTSFARVAELALDLSDYTATSGTVISRGTASAIVPGAQFEFDVGAGFIRRGSHAADINVNMLAAGPNINARDQAGAFAGSSWIYLYALLFTTDLVTVGYVWSANPPSVGPSLLGPLTAWQSPIYCGAWRVNVAGTALLLGFRRREWFFWISSGVANNIVSTATAPTAEQSSSLSAVLPPTCKEWILDTRGSQAGNTVINLTVTLLLRILTTIQYTQRTQLTQVASQSSSFNDLIRMPYDGTNLFWLWQFGGTSAGTLATNLAAHAYRDLS